MGIDYLLVPFNLKKKSVRISLLSAIKKSYSELTGRYDQIYMRGFPELFFAENPELTKFADDMIVVVDSDYTTYEQLAGTINGLNEQKVRGLAMLRA
jgi:hypothetical protein